MKDKKQSEKMIRRRNSQHRAFVFTTGESPRAPMHWTIGL